MFFFFGSILTKFKKNGFENANKIHHTTKLEKNRP